jgi:RNA polymerase sigma-70 factor (ECF subfamily)
MILALFGMTVASTDEELVQRFKRGDRSAYSEFVTRYQDRVYTYCLRWLGNKERAEEIAQDCFFKMYRALPRFRGESKLQTWVFRVVLNTCKNERLRLKRRKARFHDSLDGTRGPDGETTVRQIPTTGPGTDHGTHRSEAETIVRRGLDRLEDDHAKIIILRDIQGQPYEEIARELNIPRGTVKSRLHRARKAFEEGLIADGVNIEDIFD